MKIILSKSGQKIKVDDEDYEYLNQFSWHSSVGYATRDINHRTIYMHREIMNPTEGFQVDHINHDKFNNKRENLRLCTPRQNSRNRSGWGKSKYLGVSTSTIKGKWIAYIYLSKRQTVLGHYETEKEAAIAYDIAAIKSHGEFANLNILKPISKKDNE